MLRTHVRYLQLNNIQHHRLGDANQVKARRGLNRSVEDVNRTKRFLHDQRICVTENRVQRCYLFQIFHQDPSVAMIDNSDQFDFFNILMLIILLMVSTEASW